MECKDELINKNWSFTCYKSIQIKLFWACWYLFFRVYTFWFFRGFSSHFEPIMRQGLFQCDSFININLQKLFNQVFGFITHFHPLLSYKTGLLC